MKTTANYSLKKPDGNDVVNIDDFNYNADIIDTKIKEVDNRVSNIKAPVTSVNNRTGAVTLGASDIGAETPENASKKANTAESNSKLYTDGKIKAVNSTLNEISNKVSNIKVPVTSVNGKAGAIVLNSNDIKTNDGSTVEKKVNDVKSEINSTATYFNNIASILNTALQEVDSKTKDVSERTTTAQNTANSAVAKADNAQSTANAAKQRAEQAFQYADNGKKKISNVVGSPLSANQTFDEQAKLLQDMKVQLYYNLLTRNVSFTESGVTLKQLIEKVNKIKTQTGEIITYPRSSITNAFIDDNFYYCTNSWFGSSQYYTKIYRYDKNMNIIKETTISTRKDSFSQIIKTQLYYYAFYQTTYTDDGDRYNSTYMRIYDLDFSHIIKEEYFKDEPFGHAITDGKNTVWFYTGGHIRRVVDTYIVNTVTEEHRNSVGIMNESKIVTQNSVYDLELKKLSSHNYNNLVIPSNFSRKNKAVFYTTILELQGNELRSTGKQIRHNESIGDPIIIDNIIFTRFYPHNNNNAYVVACDLDTGKQIGIFGMHTRITDDNRGLVYTNDEENISYVQNFI